MYFPPEPYPSIVIFLFGLFFGSFLNVCIYRLPRGLSVIKPRSACPKCGSSIPSWLNIPVVSWLALRGKCADCHTAISVRYPLVELMTALLWWWAWYRFGLTPALGFVIVFGMAMIVLFFTDLDLKLLPDAITLTGFLLGMTVAYWNPFLNGEGLAKIWAALVGAALGSGVLWGLGAFYSKFRGVEAMGMGDVKMMAFVGSFVGFKGVLFTLFSASIVGAIVGVALVPLRGRSMNDTLPFGCFLAPASLISMLYAERAIEAYLSLFTKGVGI